MVGCCRLSSGQMAGLTREGVKVTWKPIPPEENLWIIFTWRMLEWRSATPAETAEYEKVYQTEIRNHTQGMTPEDRLGFMIRDAAVLFFEGEEDTVPLKSFESSDFKKEVERVVNKFDEGWTVLSIAGIEYDASKVTEIRCRRCVIPSAEGWCTCLSRKWSDVSIRCITLSLRTLKPVDGIFREMNYVCKL